MILLCKINFTVSAPYVNSITYMKEIINIGEDRILP